jgi:RecA-family ATPase
MLDLCLSVASGEKFLNRNTNQCNCLYLALEDSLLRLKDRMNKILKGKVPSPNFDFSITCESINNNLVGQLEEYITAKPNTSLIVIDTLQKIRANSAKGDNAYGNDYKDLSILKAFADEKNICILLVHHLRKMGDTGDVFSRISGTNAIMGACDTTFVLSRENRNSNQTILSMTGRDIEENEFLLEFDKTTFKWRMIGTLESQILQDQWNNYENDVIVKTIKKLLERSGNNYEGTATDINNKCFEFFGEYADPTPAVLSKKIRSLAPLLHSYDGILYEAPPENRQEWKEAP